MTAPARERVLRAARRLFPGAGEPSLLGCGGNSRVYRLDAETGPVVLKAYERPTMDGRSRLDVEFAALRLLEALGVPEAPRALDADPEHQVGVYSLVEGVCPDPALATEADSDALAAFLARLVRLCPSPLCRDFPKASEAHFSLAAVARSVRGRLERLGHPGGVEETQALDDFLRGAFLPGLARVETASRAILGPQAFDALLPGERRMLSPSDFGLHNALRAPDGGLAFVDFEYFGWDDPAKALSDVCLHPAMRLPPALRARFVEAFREQAGQDAADALRLRAALPLFALKWCMIFLNVFLPGFGPGDPVALAALRRERLHAARAMLDRALRAAESPRPELES